MTSESEVLVDRSSESRRVGDRSQEEGGTNRLPPPAVSAPLQELLPLAKVKEVSHDHNYVTTMSHMGEVPAVTTAAEGLNEAGHHVSPSTTVEDETEKQPPMSVPTATSNGQVEKSSPEGVPSAQGPPEVKRKRGRPRKDALKIAKAPKKPSKTTVNKNSVKNSKREKVGSKVIVLLDYLHDLYF